MFTVFIVFLYYFFIVFFISQGSFCGGDILGKMAKNCMKITKPTFSWQNSRGDMGDKLIFRVVGEIPRSPSPTKENLDPSYQIVGNHIFRRKYSWQIEMKLKRINKKDVERT